MADPGFVAADAVNSETDSVTSLEIDIPEDATAGDRLLLILTSAPATADTPDGWTELVNTSATPTASGGRMLVWTAVVGDTSDLDPGDTVTVTLSGSTRAALGILVYGPSDIDDVAVGTASTMGASPPYSRTAPTVTASDIARVVSIYGINGHNSSNDSVSWVADAATTERIDTASAAPSFRNATLMACDEAAGPGSVGGRAAIASHRTQACAVTIALSSTVSRPVASASTSTPTVAAGTVGVQLLGDASGGAGAPYTYQWRQIAGTPVTLSDPTDQNPTFDAPGESDELIFGLTVTDDDGVDSLEATVTVTVVGASGRAVPVADITVTGWAATPPESASISAVLADSNDGSYASYEDPSSAVLEVALSELTEPLAGEPVTLSVRVSQLAGSQGSVTLQLREGASTLIAQSGPHTWGTQGTVQQLSYTLSAGEVATINDWADLRVRLIFTVI